MKVSFKINGATRSVEAPGDKPLLWVVREDLGLTGSKFGCGIAQCGACTVHLDGQPVRSCSVPVSAVEGKSVTTVEGVSSAAAKAVRVLPVRPDDECDRVAGAQSVSIGRRYRFRNVGQSVPLRHLSPYPRGDSRRRRQVGGLSHA